MQFGRGTSFPPPPLEVWTDTQSETITFPHSSDAGGYEECWDRSANALYVLPFYKLQTSPTLFQSFIFRK